MAVLNFRRLKQDFSSSILKEGRDLEEKVASAKILSVDSEVVRISAAVEGNFDNCHCCEVEIDRCASELVDSNCDCTYSYDCQHLAAVLFFLERRLDELLVEFCEEEEVEEELAEVVEEVQAKAQASRDLKAQAETLQEAIKGGHILGSSPFFLPPEELKTDRAELNLILDESLVPKMTLALRLPYRSKPLYIQDVKAFLNAVRFKEPIYLAGKRYFFGPEGFGKASAAHLERLLQSAQFLDEKTVALEENTFGQLLAQAWNLAMHHHEEGGYRNAELNLPGIFVGSLEQPLKFATGHSGLRFDVDHLELPSPKIFLKSMVSLEDQVVATHSVRLFACTQPGLIYEGVYYRFAEKVKRLHLAGLDQIAELTIPQPLFGTFVENALPELMRVAEVTGTDMVEQFTTLPFVGEVKARCEIDYLDGELEARLFFCYDEIEIPAAANQLTYENIEAFVGKDGILARDLVAEEALIREIFQGFVYDASNGCWAAKTEKRVVEFMTETIPNYAERVSFEVPETLLDQFIYDETEFSLELDISDNVDVYNLELKVNGHLQGALVDRLWESIAAKRTYLELEKRSGKKKGPAKILVLDLETLTPIVQLFDELGLKRLDNHKKERPLWSLVTLSAQHFDGLPIKVTITDQLKEIQQQMLGNKSLDPTPIPKAIKAELRPYQAEGVHWLERLRKMHLSGILADDMGLGKTLQAICTLTQYHQTHERQSLIVCPTSLLYNWKEEFSRFNPKLKVQVVDGTPVQRQKILERSDDADILITSYSLIQKDIEQYVDGHFGYMILDEAQHIKNRGTRNAKSVKMVRATHRLVLSGTPVENSLDELWSLFDFLMPGLLSSYDRFVEKYIRNSVHSQGNSMETLQRKVAPFILRRMKQDVLKDLPPVSHITYHCTLNDEQKKLYQSYAASAREELSRLVEKEGFDKVQIHVLATLTRLKQICCHPAIFAKEGAEEADSAKYEMLLELLGSLIKGNHKTVIFSQYTRMLQIIRDDLEKLGVRFCYLDGSTKNRMQLVKEFNNDDGILVFLVSLKAGGTGLNLTSADTVIHYDMWWNPAVENQATDRVHRIGQKKQVSSYKLVTKGSIEEKIVELQERKRGLVKKVVSCDDEAVSKLTWEEVLELLQV